MRVDVLDIDCVTLQNLLDPVELIEDDSVNRSVVLPLSKHVARTLMPDETLGRPQLQRVDGSGPVLQWRVT